MSSSMEFEIGPEQHDEIRIGCEVVAWRRVISLEIGKRRDRVGDRRGEGLRLHDAAEQIRDVATDRDRDRVVERIADALVAGRPGDAVQLQMPCEPLGKLSKTSVNSPLSGPALSMRIM